MNFAMKIQHFAIKIYVIIKNIVNYNSQFFESISYDILYYKISYEY